MVEAYARLTFNHIPRNNEMTTFLSSHRLVPIINDNFDQVYLFLQNLYKKNIIRCLNNVMTALFIEGFIRFVCLHVSSNWLQ